MVRNFREAQLHYVNRAVKKGELSEKYRDVIDYELRSTLVLLDLTFPKKEQKIKAMDGMKFASALFGWNTYLAHRVYKYVLDNHVIDLQSESVGRQTFHYFDTDGLRAYCALAHVFINNPIYPGLTFKDLVPKTKTALGEHELKNKLQDPISRKSSKKSSQVSANSMSPKLEEENLKGYKSEAVVSDLTAGFPIFDEQQLEALREFDVDEFISRLRGQGLIGKIVKVEDVQGSLDAIKVLRLVHDIALAHRRQDALVFTPIAEFLIYDELIRWIEEYKQVMNRFPGNRNLAVMYKIIQAGISRKNPK